MGGKLHSQYPNFLSLRETFLIEARWFPRNRGIQVKVSPRNPRILRFHHENNYFLMVFVFSDSIILALRDRLLWNPTAVESAQEFALSQATREWKLKISASSSIELTTSFCLSALTELVLVSGSERRRITLRSFSSYLNLYASSRHQVNHQYRNVISSLETLNRFCQ